MTVIEGTGEHGGLWDELVTSSPHGTIFHTWDWLKITERQTHCKLHPLLIYNKENLSAIYPVFIRKVGPIRIAFSPPPKAYLLYLGPVIPDYEQMKQDKKESVFIQIQKEVDNFLFSDLKCKYVRIRTSPGIIDARPLRWSGYSVEPLYTYRLDLSRGPTAIWNSFDRKLRGDINRTEREGVVVQEGDEKDLLFLQRSLSKRFEDQKFQTSDYQDYLGDLYNRCHNKNLKIFIAWHKGERVGGMISPYGNNILYLWTGIPKCALKGISPNDLVQWEAIKWACENGFRYYELMDAGYDPRLRNFKSKYNPDLWIWYTATRTSSQFFRILSLLHG